MENVPRLFGNTCVKYTRQGDQRTLAGRAWGFKTGCCSLLWQSWSASRKLAHHSMFHVKPAYWHIHALEPTGEFGAGNEHLRTARQQMPQ